MELIRKYFPGLEAGQNRKYQLLLELIPRLNRKVNVISRKEMEHLEERHILHSLSIARIFRFHSGASVVDVGTGGGFPGIPLAVMFPQVHFLLVDSIGKKIRVIEEIIRELDLGNVRAIRSRAEELAGTFDFSVSRAVASFSRLYSWSEKLVVTGHQSNKPNGMISLKGGELDAELGPFLDRVEIFPIDRLFREPFFSGKKIVYLKK